MPASREVAGESAKTTGDAIEPESRFGRVRRLAEGPRLDSASMATMYQPGPREGQSTLAPPGALAPPSALSQRMHGPIARWVAAGLTAATGAALAGYIYFVDPNNPANAYPSCPLKAFTGIDCPGCGGLRATHSLVHGDLAGVIDHNLLAVVILPLIAYLITRWVLGLFGKELPQFRLPHWSRYLIPAAVLLFTVVRNIPSSPLYYFNSALA